MSFGEKLKYYRKMNRYSQKKLAAELEIALSTYGKYETNEYQPKFDTLIKICDKLNISPNDLLEYDKYNTKITDYGIKIIETNENYTRIELETDIFNYSETDFYPETVSFTIETEIFNHMIKYVNDGIDTETQNYAYKLQLNRIVTFMLGIFERIKFDNPDTDTVKFVHALKNLNMNIQIANRFKK